MYDPFENDSLVEAIKANTNAILRLVALWEESRNQRLYSNKEAARILGRCEDTIASYIKKGKLSRISYGTRVGIPQSDIDRELANKEAR